MLGYLHIITSLCPFYDIFSHLDKLILDNSPQYLERADFLGYFFNSFPDYSLKPAQDNNKYPFRIACTAFSEILCKIRVNRFIFV